MEELRRTREEAGLTQVGLAKASGVDRGTIIKIERGQRSPTVETLAKLARAMGAEISDFFPKAQSPLPLLDMGAAAGPPSSAPEPYALLGRILADRWRGSLREFRENPGIRPGTLKAGDCRELSRFVRDVFEATAVYEVAAEDARYSLHPGYANALREMEDVRQEAADTIRPSLNYLKARQNTDAEFRKIWEASDLDALINEAGSR